MNARADMLWASLPVPVFLIDAADRVTDINPAAESFLNVSSRSVGDQSILDVLHLDASILKQFDRVRSDHGAIFINNAEVGTARRSPVDCNIQIAPLSGMPGEVLLIMEPLGLAGSLGRSLSITTAAKSATGMAEMLAHEIKNPLAGITGAAQLLSMNLSSDDRELTDLIVAESRRIVTLLERVEQFGNLSPPDRDVVNIHDLLDRARRSAQVSFGAHMLFKEAYDPSLPPTWVDGDQMVQVLQNLIRNAAEASGGEPGIIRLRTFYDQTLRLRRSDSAPAALPLQIEIEDDGPGLPPEIASDVFEPFVSGRENGTGLGLALVSKIISDHDGWISVDTRPGRTVFRISLPVAQQTSRKDD